MRLSTVFSGMLTLFRLNQNSAPEMAWMRNSYGRQQSLLSRRSIAVWLSACLTEVLEAAKDELVSLVICMSDMRLA